ncbi:MAG: 2Fe-2S iron-sulfur cluster-binding protein [Moorellaceae bacterium]
MNTVKIVVDGQELAVREDLPLIQALQKQGIYLPSLCYHHLLGGHGSCGLCVVEIHTGAGWRPSHACLLYPREGMQVNTDTPGTRRLRAWAARLLLRRGPFREKKVEELLLRLVGEGRREMHPASPLPSPPGTAVDAAHHTSAALRRPVVERAGTAAAFGPRPPTPAAGCILCGLCVRVCQKVGKDRLTFLWRGKNLQVGFVPGAEAEACGHCRACQRICPTGFIAPSAREAFTARLYTP